MTRRWSLALAGLVVLTGCASSVASPSSPHAGPPPSTTTPSRATGALSTGSTPTTTPPCTDPTPSWRPLQAMPARGAMPANTFEETILKRGYLKAGVSGDTYGFGYVDPATLQLQGFDVEILKEIATAIFGRADSTVLKLIPITIPQVPRAIDSDQVDIVAHTMTVTCSRRTQEDFSSVYLVAHQRLLVGKDSGITSLGQLAGKKVCAAAGTTSITNIKKLAPAAIAVPVASETDCLVQFQTGGVDAVSTDDTILDGMAKQDPYSHVVGPFLTPEPYGLAISLAHPEFTRFVNGVLARMLSGETDGILAKLYAAALNVDTTAVPLPGTTKYRD